MLTSIRVHAAIVRAGRPMGSVPAFASSPTNMNTPRPRKQQPMQELLRRTPYRIPHPESAPVASRPIKDAANWVRHLRPGCRRTRAMERWGRVPSELSCFGLIAVQPISANFIKCSNRQHDKPCYSRPLLALLGGGGRPSEHGPTDARPAGKRSHGCTVSQLLSPYKFSSHRVVRPPGTALASFYPVLV